MISYDICIRSCMTNRLVQLRTHRIGRIQWAIFFFTHRAKWMECNQWKINTIMLLNWNDQTYFQLPAKILLGNSCLPLDWWTFNALAGTVQLFKPVVWKFKLQVTYPLRQTNTINFQTLQFLTFNNIKQGSKIKSDFYNGTISEIPLQIQLRKICCRVWSQE